MVRFSNILCRRKNSILKIEEVYPKPVLSALINTGNLKKWTSYLDKYLLFKNRIKKRLTKEHDLIHITDHSNSIYASEIKKYSNVRLIITCHDLIAIRQAKYEFKEAPETSITGKLLQSWIHNSLKKADYYVCDSEQTKKDLNRIIPSSFLHSKVIHIGTEFEIGNKESQNYKKSNLSFNPASTRFILHVGSAAWYKNRNAVFQAFQYAKQQNQSNKFKLVLVGPSPQADEIDANLKKWLDNNSKDIISVTNASDEVLQELYINAEFLISLSFIEGFGWPPLEAALLGCPVICTKTGAIHDLLGNNARYVDPNNQKSINKAIFEALEKNSTLRPKVSLPSNNQCQQDYFQLYNSLI